MPHADLLLEALAYLFEREALRFYSDRARVSIGRANGQG